jgi:hypothetical protein
MCWCSEPADARRLQEATMAKIGTFVVDPKAGSYCHVGLDSGERIIISHDQGGFKGGTLSVLETRWWGFTTGETLLTCDLDSPVGRAALARLTQGVDPKSARATPLGAFVYALAECKSLADVRARCTALLGGA